MLAPQFLENKLKFSPYIGEAVVFGHDRPFVSAIVAIDAATVGNWAERHNLAYTSFQDLCARAEVLDLVRDEIARCNAGLPEAIRVRRFLVLNKEFDADDDEITRTRKIRRRFVAEKYAAIVEAFSHGCAFSVPCWNARTIGAQFSACTETMRGRRPGFTQPMRSISSNAFHTPTMPVPPPVG